MIRRLIVSATAGAVVLVVLLSTVGTVVGGSRILFLAAVPAIVGAIYLVRTRFGEAEVRWDGPTAVASPTPMAAPSGSAARALARVESRELILSPAFGVGFGFCLVLILMFGVFFPGDVDQSWQLFFSLSAMTVHPLVGLLVVAAHLGVTRARRHGCDELFESCPAGTGTRVLGHLGTAGAAALVALAFLGLLTFLVAIGNNGLYGPATADALPSFAICAVLAVGGIALGTATGRWLRFGLAPFIAVVLVGVVSMLLLPTGRWSPSRMLATFDVSTGVDFLFVEVRPWARLAWITALTVLVACIALLGLRRWAGPALGAAAVATVVAGLVVARPMSESRAELAASRIADPLAHSHCVMAGPEVEVCAFERYGDHAERVAAELRPTAAAVPGGVLDDVLLLQHNTQPIDKLPVEVEKALGGRPPVIPEGSILVRFHSMQGNFESLRLRLAASAVGLPVEPVDDYAQPIAGEARGVVMLWLATRGMEANHVDSLLSIEGDVADSTRAPGMIWPGSCEGDPGSVIWGSQDVLAAQAITALPEDNVRAVIHDGWDRFTDQDTPTDALLTALGLPSAGPIEHVAPARYEC